MNRKKLLCCILLFYTLTAFSDPVDEICNGSVIEEKKENGHTILIRKHDQIITIDYSAQEFQKEMYNSPLEKKTVGRLKEKDEIFVHEIVILDSREVWLKISLKGLTGYILYDQSEVDPVYDFYKDGLWQHLSDIQSGDMVWHTLKCEQAFTVYTNLNIRDTPGISGKKIGMITARQSSPVIVKTTEVTKEKDTIDSKTERWAYIEYNGIKGWVFAGYLEYERGGPRFYTPESLLEMSLGAGP